MSVMFLALNNLISGPRDHYSSQKAAFQPKRLLSSKVVNSVSVGVLFFQLEWNVSVSECFDVPFRGYTVHIYIYNKHNSNS
jgi:hypothetical protein